MYVLDIILVDPYNTGCDCYIDIHVLSYEMLVCCYGDVVVATVNDSLSEISKTTPESGVENASNANYSLKGTCI